MQPIYLIGFMGSGKTTLGEALAAHSHLAFIDLDHLIEKENGASVSEIFARMGEAAFRRLERETLQRVSAMTDVVVATGGGTPCQEGLMDIMLGTGKVVYLDAVHDVLWRRLCEGKATRPLIAALSDEELHDFIDSTLERRMPHYSRAHVSFDSSRLESEQQIASSVESLMRLLSEK